MDTVVFRSDSVFGRKTVRAERMFLMKEKECFPLEMTIVHLAGWQWTFISFRFEFRGRFFFVNDDNRRLVLRLVYNMGSYDYIYYFFLTIS